MECKNFPNCDTDFSKRIAALEAELAEAKRVTFDPAVLEDMNRLEAENAELRKDAERYRWLRDRLHSAVGGGIEVNDAALVYEECDPEDVVRLYWYPVTTVGFNEVKAATIDEAIDAAKEAQS